MKKILIILLLSLVILSAGCAEEQNGTAEISDDAVITYLSYGAFTLQDMAIQELIVNSTDVSLSYYNSEKQLTARYVQPVDEETRNSLLQLLEENEFLRMNALYEPLEGQPIVADTGTVEISVAQDGTTKTVIVTPYSQDYMPGKLREIDEALLQLKIYAMSIPEDEAKQIAEDWIASAPTYSYDGSELQLQDYQSNEDYPEEPVLTYSFVSSHGGYGDRSDSMSTEVITSHTIEITLYNGEVASAIIDDKWDEMNQIMLDEVVEMQSEQMQCDQTPWQLWYADGDVNFIREPTEKELVIAYFSTIYEIEISDFDSVTLENGMCQYTIKVKQAYTKSLSEIGWQRI